MPDWLRPLATAARTVRAEQLSRFVPPADGSGRRSAVLMLFASPDGVAEADLLLLQRADTCAAMPVRWPSRAARPIRPMPARRPPRCARPRRRSASDPDSVDVLAELPALYLPPSAFVVTPVLGYWAQPHPVGVVDAGRGGRGRAGCRCPSCWSRPTGSWCGTRPGSSGRASRWPGCSSGVSPPA